MTNYSPSSPSPSSPPPSSGSSSGAKKGKKLGLWFKFFLITFALLAAIVIWSFADGWLAQFPYLLIVRRILPFAVGAVVGYILIVHMTQAPYSAIALFFISAYCILVTIENYYLGLDSGASAFVPKLGIEGADAGNWLTRLGDIIQGRPQQFFLAAFFAICAQFLQSSLLRDMTSFFDGTKKTFTSGDPNKIGAGAAMVSVTLISWLVDAATSVAQYPLWGVDSTQWFINFIWNLVSILGFEVLYERGRQILEKHGML